MGETQFACSPRFQFGIALIGLERIAAILHEFDGGVEVCPCQVAIGPGGDDLAIELVGMEW